MKLADNIYNLRRTKGISQEELAEICKVSRQAIAKWENNESVPTIEKLLQLADYFNVTLDEIVGRKAIDKFEHFKSYIFEHAANDIPQNEDDDISAIVSRYLLFMESLDLSAEEKLRGLQEIFLSLNE